MSFETVAGLAMVSSEFAELINAKRMVPTRRTTDAIEKNRDVNSCTR